MSGTTAQRGVAVDEDDLERSIREVGTDLASAFPSNTRHPLRAIDQRAMDLASADRQLRAALFRFVDVTPACRSLDDLARHLREYLREVPSTPPPLAAAMKMADVKAGRAALGAAAAAGVRHMAHRFIVGETPAAALGVLRELWNRGVASSVDLLGEATVTQAEADRYASRCDEALSKLAGISAGWPARDVLERDSVGPIPRTNVSVKISALTPLLRPDAPERGRRDAAERLRPLLRRADQLGAHIHIDMESLDSREAVLDLVLEVLSEEEFSRGPSAGLVLQAYLRDSPEQVDRVLEWASSSGRTPPLTVRLVKGAYWDHELVQASQHGWSVPVFEVKAECDRNFETLTRRLLDARPAVRVAIASHNLRSVSHAIAYSRALGAEDRDLELQILRGLGDQLADALASRGFRVRAYCPIGDLVAGMAYLVRRLLENTSNESFLYEQARGVPLEQLLAAP
ncbi:MAG TPA: proline dehydrogenase family protein [Solirubrobacteraceae bacterium]|nr:proline dehydrogenase family protein [Solirubrobacteraceae bacterium]